MRNTLLKPRDQQLLNQAAALLDHAGRLADAAHDEAAIHALNAADLLVHTGANPHPVGESRSDTRAAIQQALQLLGNVSAGLFDTRAVSYAIDTALKAFSAS